MSEPLSQPENFERLPQEGATSGFAETTSQAAAHGAEHGDSALHVVFIPDNIGSFLGYDFSNTLLTSVIASLFLITFAFYIGRKITTTGTPGRLQIFFEGLVEYIHDQMNKILGSDRITTIAFPLIITLFLYILVANWIEFLPGIGSIRFIDPATGKLGETYLFRGPNTDLNMTIALAIISFVFIEFMGFRSQGFAYLKNFFNFSSPINFFVGLIELISEFARLISLPFRLFGNIFAGEILVLLAITLQKVVFEWIKIPFPFPVPIMLFEIGVGLLQAAVFALLTLFFIKQATTAHQH